MATYTITVNGKLFDVDVEKKTGTIVANKVTPSAAPVPSATVPPPPSAPIKAPAVDGTLAQIAAPMPGKVIAVKVAIGEVIKKDQVAVMVEAMKMHNPILAPKDGVVKEIYVAAGDSIQTGQPLVAIG
jgi:biotin carboxyl carrier protein